MDTAIGAVPRARARQILKSAAPFVILSGSYALGLSGFDLLDDLDLRPLGVAAIAAGACAAAVATHDLFPPSPRRLRVAALRPERGYLLRLLVATILTTLGWLTFARDPHAPFGIAGVLWLASISVLIGAAVRATRGYATTDTTASSSTPPWDRWDVLLVAVIVVLAVGARTWRLAEVPFAINPDEIAVGMVARDAFLGPQHSVSIFAQVWQGSNAPALFFVLVASAFSLFGENLAALRLTATLLGAMAVVPLYAFVRDSWGRLAATLATVTLAVTISNVGMSRVTVYNIAPQLFWSAVFFFLVRALRTQRPIYWALAGLAGGFSEHFYFGTRLLPPLLFVFVGLALIMRRAQIRAVLGNAGLMLLAYGVGMGPSLLHFIRDPGAYYGRGIMASASGQGLIEHWNRFVHAIQQACLMVATNPSNDSFHYVSPLLLVPAAPLLVSGIVIIALRWREPESWMVLGSIAAILVVGLGIITPTGALIHTTPAFPAVATAIGIAAAAWLRSTSHLPATLGRPLAGALIVGGICICWANLDAYLNRSYPTRPQWELPAAQARYIAAISYTHRSRNVARSWQGYNAHMTQFLSERPDAAQMWNPSIELPVPPVDGKGLSFIFVSDNRQYSSIVSAYYPGGASGQVTNQAQSTHLFDTYILDAERVKATQGVFTEARVGSNGPVQWSGLVGTVGDLPEGISYPSMVTWSGSVLLPQPGPYTIDLAGLGATLEIDGRTVTLPFQLEATAGWHRFVVAGVVARPSPIGLMLGRAGQETAEPRSRDLWPWAPDRGLIGLSSSEGGWSAPRIDPFVGFTGLNEPGALAPRRGAPLSARWRGEINAPRDGLFLVALRTDGEATLRLNGSPALAVCETRPVTEGKAIVSLAEGWQPIELDFHSDGRATTLELYWAEDGEVAQIVAPSALRFERQGGRVPAVAPPRRNTGCPSP